MTLTAATTASIALPPVLRLAFPDCSAVQSHVWQSACCSGKDFSRAIVSIPPRMTMGKQKIHDPVHEPCRTHLFHCGSPLVITPHQTVCVTSRFSSTPLTSVGGSQSCRTTTCHSASAHAHIAVRFLRASGTLLSGKKPVVGAGSANVAGGESGACGALHHEGRSPGRSAAVQSSPTRQR